jgi:hypothetical protein
MSISLYENLEAELIKVTTTVKSENDTPEP